MSLDYQAIITKGYLDEEDGQDFQLILSEGYTWGTVEAVLYPIPLNVVFSSPSIAPEFFSGSIEIIFSGEYEGGGNN